MTATKTKPKEMSPEEMRAEIDRLKKGQVQGALAANVRKEKVNTWVDELDDEGTIHTQISEKPMYYDVNEQWPALDKNRLSGSASFCEYEVESDGRQTGNIKINREKMEKGLFFNEPNDVEPMDAGVFVKGIKPDGTYTQVELSPYINGSGMEGRQGPLFWAKGKRFHMFWNDEKQTTSLFCLASNCYAKAMTKELIDDYPEYMSATGTGYCSLQHAAKSQPHRYNASDPGQMMVAEAYADLASVTRV